MSKAAVTCPCSAPLTHKARVTAPAERERERIEQDRFARAGLAGEHGEARRAIDVEPFDQDMSRIERRESMAQSSGPILTFASLSAGSLANVRIKGPLANIRF